MALLISTKIVLLAAGFIGLCFTCSGLVSAAEKDIEDYKRNPS